MSDAPQQGTPNFDSRLIWVIGLVAVVLFFVIIVSIQAGFRFVWNQEVVNKVYDWERISQVESELTVLEKDQQAKITTARWVDEQQTTAAIPIDEAIEAYIARQRR